jgi:hypothetical protein
MMNTPSRLFRDVPSVFGGFSQRKNKLNFLMRGIYLMKSLKSSELT